MDRAVLFFICSIITVAVLATSRRVRPIIREKRLPLGAKDKGF